MIVAILSLNLKCTYKFIQVKLVKLFKVTLFLALLISTLV